MGLKGQVSCQNQDLLDYRGFSGFARRAFGGQALIHIRLGWISGYGENRKSGAVES